MNRAPPNAVALETTLLIHGVPPETAAPLFHDLVADAARAGSQAALIGVVAGRPTVGMTEAEFRQLLAVSKGTDAARPGSGLSGVAKLNTSNLGIAIHRGEHGATTVSATAELAAAAGLSVFATGGLGGVHRGFGERLDVSSDLAALARFPVCVVASGVKNLLDVVSTREALETLGVPVVGYRTDAFPAFYVRESEASVDARFDDPAGLASFVEAELQRTGRGVLVCQPVPESHAFTAGEWEAILARAQGEARTGRDATPDVLSAVHRLSDGRTLDANIALVRANVTLAGQIRASFGQTRA
ncbi:MAG: pseudouridine-5'-phosphate glycosidase [Planctomycetota bacterium]